MQYHCPHCNHDQENLLGSSHPFCPQCGNQWEPVDSVLSDQVSLSLSTEQKATDLQKDLLSQEAELSCPKGTVNKVDKSDEFFSPGSSQPQMLLEVNLGTMTLTHNGLSLEVKISNQTRNRIQGQVWLSIQSGEEGTPARFNLANSKDYFSRGLSLRQFSSEGGIVQVRVNDGSTGAAYWQGYLTIQPRTDNQVVVNISSQRVIEGSTVLEGVDNGVHQTVNLDMGTNPARWEILPLFLCTNKEMARISDKDQPGDAIKLFRRPVRIQSKEGPLAGDVEVETARLSLCRFSQGKEQVVNLLAGPKLLIGRQRTSPASRGETQQHNDLYLRSLSADPLDNYISRIHGSFEFTEQGLQYQNLSTNGTAAGFNKLLNPGDHCILSSGINLQFGCSSQKGAPNLLRLKSRITTNDVSEQLYNTTAQNWGLLSGLPVKTGPASCVVLERSDKLKDDEKYIFFQNAFSIGRANHCAWKIEQDSIQAIHATIFWMDRSFWIEPYAADCFVSVRGTKVEVNHLTRLLPDETVQIGELKFIVLPQWYQHITHCECCQGHGYNFGCRCAQCQKIHDKNS